MTNMFNWLILGNIGKDIYTQQNNEINQSLLKLVKYIGGSGGLAFTLAFLVIALIIGFGSISSAKMGTVWKMLISCAAGAFIFFTAYLLAPAIAKIAG